ncbi:MAG: ATP-binding cassette domain-containing protein [Cyclobacteriaceae bacterium]|nr:ATP-binding cassette domain-containing protein [Cyclobacteriaceae bacterium]
MLLTSTEVSKSFRKKLVLNKVNFSVNLGEIVGIIGPNGSGKTTLLNLIMGLLKVDSGTISCNHALSAAVSRKGFFEGMTVYDNMKVYAHLKKQNLSEIDRALELFDIDFGKTNFGKLSAGMKQRVALAQAFMGDYKLILLDEPTNHLDIDSIFKLRSAIEARKKSGTSFILTSHVLTELEKLCNRALFLFKGKIVKEVTATDTGFANLEEEYLKLSVK